MSLKISKGRSNSRILRGWIPSWLRMTSDSPSLLSWPRCFRQGIMCQYCRQENGWSGGSLRRNKNQRLPSMRKVTAVVVLVAHKRMDRTCQARYREWTTKISPMKTERTLFVFLAMKVMSTSIHSRRGNCERFSKGRFNGGQWSNCILFYNHLA